MATHRVGVGLLVGAAAAGLVHAAFTIYWAAGGRWLLRTVGAWAVPLADQNPVACAAVLGAVAVLKIAGALIPVAVETRRVPGRRGWRRLAWTGAVVLIGYGLLNVVVGWAVLGGVLSTNGGYDRSAELGHAALWDPLFLLWGLLLAGGLRLTRGRAALVR
ncbi:DUF3995 domain-containing protein [uncultured Jatrophihabitans sp.]|uniref:DUF3995 domain-containing protein n=1 Tax=uncultured Jatrophihabitans sp. TaxID=1610747 RepID=UPI0035CA2CDB